MATTLNGNSLDKRGQPALKRLATTAVVPPPASAPAAPAVAGDPAVLRAQMSARGHRLDWATPPVWAVWLSAAFTATAGVLAAENRNAALGIIGLMAVMGVAWSVQDWRYRRHQANFEVAYGSAALVAVGALGCAAILAGTAVTPVLLLMPIAVALLALTAGTRSMGEAGIAAALSCTLVIGLRATIGLDEPVSTTAMLVGGSAALSAGAFAFGRRLRGIDVDVPAAGGRRFKPRKKSGGAAQLDADTIAHLREASDPLAVVRIAADHLKTVGDPAYVAISELIPETDILMPLVELSSLDIDVEAVRDGVVSLSREALADGGERVITSDGREYASVLCHKLGMKAVAVLPLRRLNRTVGVIHLGWTELTEASAPETALQAATELADWITPDLAIASIASEIERGYVGAMASVSASLESRDLHTSGHSRRVAKLALEIAELMGLGEHEQRQLVYAAEIHDLGRVGVSDRILDKPGELTDEEWAQIKMIPTLGAEIVEPVSFFGEVREAILHMRERWDGNGYPEGIPGTQIPLLARILAVADAFDAMTSPRPYREAMSAPDALRQLWRERGSRFDPKIVEIFVEHRVKGREAAG